MLLVTQFVFEQVRQTVEELDSFTDLNVNFSGRCVSHKEWVELNHAEGLQVDTRNISRHALVVRIVLDGGGPHPEQKVSKSNQ